MTTTLPISPSTNTQLSLRHSPTNNSRHRKENDRLIQTKQHKLRDNTSTINSSMAALPSSPSLQLSTTTISATHFPYPRAAFPIKPHAPKQSSITRATTDDNKGDTTQEPESKPRSASDDQFESRLSQVRLRYRSGTGKKAELRKAKKGKSGSGSGSGMYLPPVPLKKSVSDGLKVEFGFSPYSERVNGRIAILGLSALLLVELATGKSVINYHTPAIVVVQIYFVAAVTALYVKYEKEKVSIWPESAPSEE